MKRLADLKRIPVGQKLKLVASTGGQASVGKIRTVVRVQSNAVVFDVDGQHFWLYFPKQTHFVGREGGFRIILPNDGFMDYEEVSE